MERRGQEINSSSSAGAIEPVMLLTAREEGILRISGPWEPILRIQSGRVDVRLCI